MITEDYVSFEVAKLLKEKGFKEITQGYINADKEVYMLPFQQGIYELGKKQYPYPTLQMAMKWLRETYNIFIQIDCVVLAKNSFDYVYEIHDMCKGYSITTSTFRDNYETYEKAIEAAIKYCLINLI